MIITPIGHTEFLVDIDNDTGENIRILIDSWLSDYAVGDMMERTVKVRLDPEKMKTIDAIYISHSHCDHFDPYTLVEIYTHASPLLILPFTLRYLEGLIHEYLPQVEIHWLGNREIFSFHGIEIAGYMWSNPDITNEDDVMMIAISNETELLFAEIDTIPDPYEEEVQKSLYKVFTRKKYMTACYLASRNCLEGQIPYYDLPDSKRKAFREKYIADQKEDILASYEKYEYEEYAHFPNLFALSGFSRGFIGQGIRYPREISPNLSKLALFPLDEIASIESDYAKNIGYEFSQKALLSGRQYKIENGTIEQGRKECPIGELLKDTDTSSGEVLHEERIYAVGPLSPREIGVSEIDIGKQQILEILNSRFLPYWAASPIASLRDVLIRNDGIYRIEFRVSVSPSEKGEGEGILFQKQEQTHPSLPFSGRGQEIIFEYSTSRSSFIEVPFEDGMKIDEDYWFLDILDFLEGKQEMYSSFWHRLDPKKAYRLWTCLGATWINHDLNIAKYRLHFERAIQGKTAENFVQGVLDNIKNQHYLLKSKI